MLGYLRDLGTFSIDSRLMVILVIQPGKISCKRHRFEFVCSCRFLLLLGASLAGLILDKLSISGCLLLTRLLGGGGAPKELEPDYS